jgi:hypothetical protein
VEKLLFSVTLLRGTFSRTAIEIMKWVKKIAVAQAKVSHILSPEIPHSKNSLSLIMKGKKGEMHYQL